MVKVSSFDVPPTENVTVRFEAVTARLAAVMSRLPVNEALPTPGLNRQSLGRVSTKVWLAPRAKSAAAPSVRTMSPSAVKAAPLVELAARSSGTLLPPVGWVTTTSARSRGQIQTDSPTTMPSRSRNFFMLYAENLPKRPLPLVHPLFIDSLDKVLHPQGGANNRGEQGSCPGAAHELHPGGVLGDGL